MGAEAAVGFPTLLLAGLGEDVSHALSGRFRREGYHVLAAQDWETAHNLIRTHSRPIHILLTVPDKAGVELAESSKPYRPAMRVLYVSDQPAENLPDAIRQYDVMASVHSLLPPARTRIHTMTARSGA